MRNTLLLITLLVVCQSVFAQKGLTGLWTGVLSNDSTTVRKDQSFEIALTQYKEKVYGYTRSSFIVNDTLFYIVKRVKGKVNGDVCEVKDDEIIAYNFRGRIDKGVKVTYTFRMNQADSTWQLDGDWKTNKTKNFYSVTGKAALKEETNLDNSKIFPHLEELNLDKDVEFYASAKNPPPAKPKSEPAKPVVSRKEVVKVKEPVASNTKQEKKLETDTETRVKNSEKNIPLTSEKETVATNKTPEPKKESKQENKPVSSSKAADEEIIANNNNISNKKDTVLVAGKEPNQPAAVNTASVPVAAAKIAERVTAPAQVVHFSSDSLLLSLYDNGEVDGDTVSVLLNGEIILAKQGLKVTAIKKTILIPAGQDELTLLLYAENLGKYPPNTGLLVVRDGEEVYQVRFSADLTRNASIIFRRKKSGP